jgi:hypothetical protein
MPTFGSEAIGQLYFGNPGTGSGSYADNKTTFLAQNPGLTLQDFEGIASPGGITAAPSFTGFTLTHADGSVDVADKAYFDPDAPFAALTVVDVPLFGTPDLTITFSGSGVRAAGFNFCLPLSGTAFGLGTIKFYSGATLLYTRTIAYPGAIDAPNVFAQFSGYAVAP